MTTAGSSSDLTAPLRARLPQIEEACLGQIYEIGDPTTVADPSYQEGLQLAVSAALEHGLAAIQAPTEAGEIPLPLLAQARAAAHSGVNMETVLRRCCACDAVLRSCLIEEAGNAELDSSTLRSLLHSQETFFDRLLEAVGREYRQALEARLDPAQRHLKRIKRLLASESVETAEILYDFDAHHVGLVIAGPAEIEAVRSLAQALNRRALVASAEKDVLWAWLGGVKKLDAQRVRRTASARTWPAGVSVAIGEPSHGMDGWRLTHRQAQAALAVAERSSKQVSRYAEVAILSAAMHDDLLIGSLNQLYLSPLENDRKRGEMLRETLRAYFSSQRNVNSTAVVLGVKRHTVTNRLRAVEDLLGQPLTACATALDLALSLEELSTSD